ncbi:MAG: DUF4394 domain-containing protein [Hyphomicrobiaceae bacterium]|nr:DUF4394 domain-containing protein [Hyphomicrobiaceae bacterium]
MRTIHLAIVTLLASGAAAPAALAASAVGLVGDNTLVMIEEGKPAVGKAVTVKGVQRLLGIDVRPSDKKLYGVGADGTVVTIDVATGEATKVTTLDKMIPANASAIVDFNPAADKLRFMGSDGTNLRADLATGKVVTDGSLAFETGDMHAGEKPNVVAAAYTNSYGKPEKTAMFNIDATIVALIQQTKPNDGTLKAIGKLGLASGKTFAFDVATTADGTNTAWLVADNVLHTVALDTGKATMVGKLEGAEQPIRDIAVMPAS